MSFYFRSRFSVRAPGSVVPAVSEDWRGDCYAGRTTVEGPASPSGGRTSRRTVSVRFRGLVGVTVRRVTATVDDTVVGRARGRRVVLRFAGRACGPVRVRIVAEGRRRDGRTVQGVQRHTFRLCSADR